MTVPDVASRPAEDDPLIEAAAVAREDGNLRQISVLRELATLPAAAASLRPGAGGTTAGSNAGSTPAATSTPALRGRSAT